MKLRDVLDLLQQVSKKIGSAPPFICGGTPRDKFMDHLENISDLDITTGDKTVDYLSQEFAISLKKDYNISRKTMEDGHSTVYLGNLKIDFSSNFNVPNIDSILKKQGISNPSSLQKEMYSRDFTCNALLMSLDLRQITDPTHQGFQDINKKIIKTCLDPSITLTTNKNRVVRSIYLATKLDFNLDNDLMSFVAKNPQTIKIASNKVLSEKLQAAFVKDPDRSSFLLSKMNLWNFIPISPLIQPYYMKYVKK